MIRFYIAESALPNRSTELVQSLRRELMNNNYDYMPLESEESFPRSGASPPSHLPPPPQHHSTELAPSINDIYLPRALPSPQLSGETHSPINEVRVPRAHTSSHSVERTNIPVNDTTAPYPTLTPLPDYVFEDSAPGSGTPGLDKHDLLYYMDDHDLNRRRALAAATANVPSPTNTTTEQLYIEEEGEAEVDIIDTTPKVKYKIIKVTHVPASITMWKGDKNLIQWLEPHLANSSIRLRDYGD